MASRRYRRRDLPKAPVVRRRRRPGGKVLLALAVVVVVLLAAGVPILGGRLWFSESRDVAPVEACGGPDCQVRSYVAVDGRPLTDPLSFVTRADSAVELDFVFRGFPVPPDEMHIVAPENQRWLVTEGTLEHPESWPAAAGEGALWTSAWDRAGNGARPVVRTWRQDAVQNWLHVLSMPPSLQLPSGGYALGSDALLTVPAGVAPGNYSLSLEVKGSEGGRSLTARARLVVSVLAEGPGLTRLQGLPPSGRALYASMCAGCHGNTPNEALRARLSATSVAVPVDGSHANLALGEEDAGELVSYLTSALAQPTSLLAAIPHPAQSAPCLDCHGPKAMAPMPAGHSTSAAACTSCHQQGPPSMAGPLIPHREQADGLCSACHVPSGRLPLPDTHRGRGDESCLVCHSYSAVTAPSLPHPSLEAWGCLACHDRTSEMPIPESHRRTADWICLACHESASPGP